MNTEIPWEVLMLNNQYKDNVFIIVTSGAVIISKLSYNNKTKIILLYKLLVGRISKIQN